MWPGLTGTARVHSDLIKLDSLSWGTFTSRYIQFFQINPACKGGFVLKVLPLILPPIRRSTAKQKGKRCLSHLCPFCCFLSAACTLLLGSYFLRSAFRNRLETLWKCITALQAFLQCTGLQTQRPTAGRARQRCRQELTVKAGLFTQRLTNFYCTYSRLPLAQLPKFPT